MNLKKELVLLSDKLDRLGLTKDADVIDHLLNKIASEGAMSLLDDEVAEEAADDTKTS